MKPIVIIVNGYAGAGKDTFCEIGHQHYICATLSTVDTVKDLALQMGWDKEKTEENRNMLSALKDFYTEWFDGPFKEIVYCITYETTYNESNPPAGETQFIFLHIREPKEIQRVTSWCDDNDIQLHTVYIQSDKAEEQTHGNHADNNVRNMIYDIYIHNNGSLDLFRMNTLSVLRDFSE